MATTRKKQPQSEALGAILRQKREAMGYSKNRLAKAVGVPDSTVLRFESGEFAAPRPDKLARFAQLLGLSLADLYAQAGYIVPDELPSFASYLPTKYPALPIEAISELQEHFEELVTRLGLVFDQPIAVMEEIVDEQG